MTKNYDNLSVILCTLKVPVLRPYFIATTWKPVPTAIDYNKI